MKTSFLVAAMSIALATLAASASASEEGGDFPVGLADTLSLLTDAELRDLKSDPDAGRQFLRSLTAKQAMERAAREQGLTAEPKIQRALAAARLKILVEELSARYQAENPAPKGAIEAFAKDYYDAYKERFLRPRKIKIQQISLFSDPCEPEKTRRTLESVKARIDQGEAFADLAREVSEAPNASVGGKVNEWLVDTPALTASPFFSQAFALSAVGEVSPPVEFGKGFHILRLVANTPSAILPFEAVQESITRNLRAAYQTNNIRAFKNSFYPKADALVDLERLNRLVSGHLKQRVR